MKCLLSLTCLSLLTIMPVHAQTLTISFDKSGSNPLLSDIHFAASAASFVANEVSSLKEGDIVRFKSFGARSEASNLLDQSFTISRRLKAKQLANAIKEHIQNLPNQTGISQGSTNLIAAIEFDDELDCANNGSAIYLTDGIESSEYINGRELIEGKAHLPKPDIDLTGCSITFYGLGAGASGPAGRIIRQEWKQYAERAGASFIAKMK